jgi:hypothetical protein
MATLSNHEEHLPRVLLSSPSLTLWGLFNSCDIYIVGSRDWMCKHLVPQGKRWVLMANENHAIMTHLCLVGTSLDVSHNACEGCTPNIDAKVIVGVWWPTTRHGGTLGDIRRASAYAELDGNAKRWMIYTGSGPLSSNSLTSSRSVAFCVGLIVWLCMYKGVHHASLYIGREGRARNWS